MLPSISSGLTGIASRPVCGSEDVHEIGASIVNKSLKPSEDDADRSATCPSLPLISEGSFTSLVSKNSGEALDTYKGQGNRDEEEQVAIPKADSDTHSYYYSGLKPKQFQLNCELKNADRGWNPRGLNPRLANSSHTSSHLPMMGLHVLSTSQRLLLEQSLGQPGLRIVQKRREKTTNDRNGYLMTLGGRTILNNRYRMPAVTSLASPRMQEASVPSSVPELTLSNLHRKAANKHASIAIHSRCCCQRHLQGNEQRATTLKSRSSESLPSKERPCEGKKEGYIFKHRNQRSSLSNEKRVKPTDRPPPKKFPASSGTNVSQLKKKNKRIISEFSSDSSSHLHEEQKVETKSTPKQIREKVFNSPELKNEESLPSVSGQAEESKDELVIGEERVIKGSHEDSKGKVQEMMDVEHIEEEREILDNREQPDSSDVQSPVLSSETCNQKKSANLRLLKVTSEVPVDSAQAKVFRKLDTDCDGHISFTELRKSLPQQLTRQQINYLKKIYDMACESTFFGLEEFVAAHEMCNILAKSSPQVSNSLSNMDSSAMDLWINSSMELFRKADKNQSGVIDMKSFETLLATVVNAQPNSFITQNVLGILGKAVDDTISGVELLAYIPYFVAISSKNT